MFLGELMTTILLMSMSVAAVPRPMSLTVVELGGNVNLSCPMSEREGRFFHWYKQTPGFMIETIAAGTFSKQSLQGPYQNSRFKVAERESFSFLSIDNVTKEDEASYFCQNGTAYSQTFVKAVFVAVRDHSLQNSVLVKQSPAMASVDPGHAMTLHCSVLSKNVTNQVQCPAEDRVHWFRAGSQLSGSGLIYTPQKGRAEGKSCIYSLTKTIHDSSDAGTYYCAVALCGEILFGEGTKVETRIEWSLTVAVFGLLLALCVIVIAILIFSKDSRCC